MTTITFDEPVNIPVTKFKNIKEFLDCLIKIATLDFKELKNDEVSVEMLKKAQKTSEKDLSDFEYFT